jgi:hypothetical protein
MQIPRTVLIHTITHSARVSVDEFNLPTFGTPQEIKYVRMEPSKETSLTGLGEMKNDKYLMFYDCVNSYPVGRSFKEHDRVVYNGLTLFIRKIRECPGERAMHHYEISLVGSGD